MDRIKFFIAALLFIFLMDVLPLAAQWNGEPDATFGNGGKVIQYFNSFGSTATALHILTDGNILLAGTSLPANTFVSKLLNDGSTDNTFGNGGAVEYLFGAYNASCTDMTAQSDGKILVTGYLKQADTSMYDQLFVARLNSDGAIDAGFGSNGLYTYNAPLGSMGLFIKVQPDGKILAGGYVGAGIEQGNSVSNYLLIRLNSDGTPDTGFDGTGVTTPDFDTLSDIAADIAVQNDGKIILAGNSFNYTYTASYMTIVRINSDGSPDTGFGSGGKVLCNITVPYSWEDQFLSVVVQPDGKIVCGGHATSIAAFIRLNTDGTPDTGFGNNGQVTYVYNSSLTMVQALALQDDGKILWGGYTDYGPAQAVMLTGRLLASGQVDSTWGSNMNGAQHLYVMGTTTNCSINDMALQPDGKLLVCGYGTNTLSASFAAAARLLTGQNTGTTPLPAPSQAYTYPSMVMPGQEFTLQLPAATVVNSIEAVDMRGAAIALHFKQTDDNHIVCKAPDTRSLYILQITSGRNVCRVKQVVY